MTHPTTPPELPGVQIASNFSFDFACNLTDEGARVAEKIIHDALTAALNTAVLEIAQRCDVYVQDARVPS